MVAPELPAEEARQGRRYSVGGGGRTVKPPEQYLVFS